MGWRWWPRGWPTAAPRPAPAVFAQPIVSKARPELLRSHFIPTMEKLKKRAGKVVAEEEQLRLEAKAEGEDAELLIRDEFAVLCRDLYALYPLLIRYVDNSRWVGAGRPPGAAGQPGWGETGRRGRGRPLGVATGTRWWWPWG